MSIPAAWRFTISKPGSAELKRLASSLLWRRFKGCPFCNRSKVDSLRFAMAYSLRCGLGQARLGWRSRHRLSSGVELGLLQDPLATKQWTAATEVRLCDGHQGTKQTTTIAVEHGLREHATTWLSRAKFPALWTRQQAGGHCAESL